MREIINLNSNSKVYTSNSYLILGSNNSLDDVNTLIDPGRDKSIIEKIENINTGVGKRKVDIIILTHNHFDHAEFAKLIKERFRASIYAFSKEVSGLDCKLYNNDDIKIADRIFQVIHIPGHSQDSICLYCKEDKILFSGDANLQIRSKDATLESDTVNALIKLSTLDIKTIYPGHGPSLTSNCNKMIKNTLKVINGK